MLLAPRRAPYMKKWKPSLSALQREVMKDKHSGSPLSSRVAVLLICSESVGTTKIIFILLWFIDLTEVDSRLHHFLSPRRPVWSTTRRYKVVTKMTNAGFCTFLRVNVFLVRQKLLWTGYKPLIQCAQSSFHSDGKKSTIASSRAT